MKEIWTRSYIYMSYPGVVGPKPLEVWIMCLYRPTHTADDAWFHVSFLFGFSNLKMEAISSSETVVAINRLHGLIFQRLLLLCAYNFTYGADAGFVFIIDGEDWTGMWSPLNSKQSLARRVPSSGMLRSVTLVRTDVSEERRFLQEPHGLTSQKTTFFVVTTVKTSNLKNLACEVFNITLSHTVTTPNNMGKYRIRGFHIGSYGRCHLLGYSAV
jgi:hypothetical protein